MPQTFLVVQCHQCKAFQSDLEKKSKKWQCKLCGEKQSLQRVFARSHSNKDCRLVVQQYNEARGIAEEEAAEHSVDCIVEAGEGAQQQHEWQQPLGQRWQAFQEEKEDEGWTVAVPERPVCKPKRGASQAAAGGGGGKRMRQRHDATVDEAAYPGGSPGQDAASCAKNLLMPHQQPPRQPLRQQQGNGGAGLHSAAQSGAKQPQRSWQAHLPPVTAQQQQLRPQLHDHARGCQQQQPAVVALQPQRLPSSDLQQQLKATPSTKWDSWVTANDDW